MMQQQGFRSPQSSLTVDTQAAINSPTFPTTGTLCSIQKLTNHMPDKQTQIKQIIIDYENKILPFEKVIDMIKELTSKSIDKYDLDNYWTNTDIDSFVKRIATLEFTNWKNIEDELALELINEILENITDDSILERNMNALEKRYSKPTGKIIDWIFHRNITVPNEILELLKQNTSIAL